MIDRFLAGMRRARPAVMFVILLAFLTAASAVHGIAPQRVVVLETMPAPAVTEQSRFFQTYLKEMAAADGLPDMLADVEKGIAALADRVDYWWEPSGPLGETDAYTQTLLAASDRPIVFGTKLSSVKMGALLHVTPDWAASGRETAAIAHAILDGADPGAIPVAPPETFLLGLNLATALRLGIVAPPDLMQLAGPHIYR
jgi:putative tryptophan/tyrosine transport system substrate-binding protein